MEMFVSNDEVKQWECELHGLQDMELLAARLRLAWHLRQRDTARALYLSDAAEQLLSTFFPAYLDTNSGTVEFRLMRARLVLVRAEAAWLCGEFDKSGQLSDLALRLAANGDTVEAATTMADAHYLLACIGLQKGEVPVVESEISLAIQFARQAGDGMREIVAESLLANQQALRSLPLAMERWGTILNPNCQITDPVHRSYINEFLI